jgi:hypothetical protein
MRTFVLIPLLALAAPAWAGKLVFVATEAEVLDGEDMQPSVGFFLVREDVAKPAPEPDVVLLPKIVEAATHEPF